jgi:hypothetical protein
MRPANRDDVIEMCGGTFPDNIWALSVEHDGELLGIAGIHYSNPRMCFGNIKPALKNYPREIVKLAKAVIGKVAQSDVPVYAIAQPEESTAPGFLEHMGFVHILSGREGEIYKWQ